MHKLPFGLQEPGAAADTMPEKSENCNKLRCLPAVLIRILRGTNLTHPDRCDDNPAGSQTGMTGSRSHTRLFCVTLHSCIRSQSKWPVSFSWASAIRVSENQAGSGCPLPRMQQQSSSLIFPERDSFLFRGARVNRPTAWLLTVHDRLANCVPQTSSGQRHVQFS